MKILIIEDEKELSASLCNYLANEQFVCELAYDFSSALEKISLYEYACIILDITLPGGSGLDLLKELKANDKMDGVLIISAKNSLDDKVLHWAFPPGQSLAGRSEASQRALGRYGPSVMMPGWSKTLKGVTISGADHSDYWGDGAAGPSLLSTTEAGNFLRLGELRRDVSSPRSLSAAAATSTARSLVDGRSLPGPRTDCR